MKIYDHNNINPFTTFAVQKLQIKKNNKKKMKNIQHWKDFVLMNLDFVIQQMYLKYTKYLLQNF